MLIGIAYDLKADYLAMGFSEEEVAEFDTEETVAGIENALQANGYNTFRIGHVRNMITLLQQGMRWDMVFNICEGLKGPGREAQVPAVLDIWNIPYTFSDACIMGLTLNKAFTKHIVQNAGFRTAPFFVINGIKDLENCNLPFPLFVKPVLEGTGKGIDNTSLVHNRVALVEACLNRLQKGYAPLLIETFLPGREFTVGITGTGQKSKVEGVIEVVYNDPDSSRIYSYETKAEYEKLVTYTIPEAKIVKACTQMALGIWKLLSCCDAGRIDIRMDSKGYANFIEINPLAGLNHIHSDLPIICRLQGVSYNELIKKIMLSARKRYKL